MVPERLWSGVNELPTGLPTGVRPAGGAKADRVPTADVGAPIKRPGAATGVGIGGVPCASDATGTPAAITAPTVPAIPSSASRRVMCSLSFDESTGADTGVASWQSVRGGERWHILHAVWPARKREMTFHGRGRCLGA
jgi:hypothetical protein